MKYNRSYDYNEALKVIGISLEEYEINWQEYYNLAKAYYTHHGDLLVPSRFKTINGYEYNENGKQLGVWVDVQRINYSKLSQERLELLNSICFAINVYEASWQKAYNLALNYYRHYHSITIPAEFKTLNGYEYQENGIALGEWLIAQIRDYPKHPREKQILLDKINISSYEYPNLDNREYYEEQWYKNYALARAYFEYHGNLQVKSTFRTINGYEYNEKGFYLWYWLRTQRVNFADLPEEKQELLEAIDIHRKNTLKRTRKL